MERNIKISLDTAIKWYNGNNLSLKEIALQAFTEEELSESWRKITTLLDVQRALGIDFDVILHELGIYSKSSTIMDKVKFELARAAINGEDWKPSLNDDVYIASLLVSKNPYAVNDGRFIGKIIDPNTNITYYVGYEEPYKTEPLQTAMVMVFPRAITSCKSKERARHLMKHFGKFLFNMRYQDTLKYKWIG